MADKCDVAFGNILSKLERKRESVSMPPAPRSLKTISHWI